MKKYASQLSVLCESVISHNGDAMLPHIKPARAQVIDAAARLAVYADGYLKRLADATAADYPALAHYLGEEKFAQAVQTFVRATPSRNWDLNRYPIHFSGFLRYRLDDGAAHALAAVEAAVAEVFWLPDSECLTPADLAGISLERLAEQTFRTRDALKLLVLDYAANAYLSAFRAGDTPAAITPQPEYLCIVRHDHEVRRLALDPVEYELLTALRAGTPFGKALDDISATPKTDTAMVAAKLSIFLARWLENGILTADT